jgi:hypothetical protein
MDGWMDGWMDGGWMDGLMDGWMDGWMDGRLVKEYDSNQIVFTKSYFYFLSSRSRRLLTLPRFYFIHSYRHR